jgi:hypothetical protein
MAMYRKWIIMFLFIFVLFAGVQGSINYLVDPYGFNNIFSIKKLNSNKPENTGVIPKFKTHKIIKGGFNTIMLGTSRIGTMDPNIVNEYLGGNSFNFSIPASTTDIHYQSFIYATKFNKIKYLIYGIDFLSFNANITNNPQYLEVKDKMINAQAISVYDIYFNNQTFYKSIKVIFLSIFGKEKTMALKILDNGMRDYQNKKHALKIGTLNMTELIQVGIRDFFKPDGIYKKYKFSPTYLSYFKNIVDYCEKNDIKLWVYIPPMYSDHFDAIHGAGYFDEFEFFKKELAKITDYIDFTGHNTITENKNNYWDNSHLRVEFTKTVMARIFNDKSAKVPEDFGVLVTKENIDKHLIKSKAQLKSFDLSLIIMDFEK